MKLSGTIILLLIFLYIIKSRKNTSATVLVKGSDEKTIDYNIFLQKDAAISKLEKKKKRQKKEEQKKLQEMHRLEELNEGILELEILKAQKDTLIKRKLKEAMTNTVTAIKLSLYGVYTLRDKYNSLSKEFRLGSEFFEMMNKVNNMKVLYESIQKHGNIFQSKNFKLFHLIMDLGQQVQKHKDTIQIMYENLSTVIKPHYISDGPDVPQIFKEIYG